MEVKEEGAPQPMGSGSANWESFPSGLRIMVVDDDPLCLKVVEQMLKRCDYRGESCGVCAGARLTGARRDGELRNCLHVHRTYCAAPLLQCARARRPRPRSSCCATRITSSTSCSPTSTCLVRRLERCEIPV